MKRAVVIANPYAGTDRGRLGGSDAAELLRDRGWDVRVCLTEGPAHATELAAAAAGDTDLVVAVGGDGTVHETARGLMGTDCPLGVLPSGSGNDFAQGIGCPTVKEGLSAIEGGHLQRIDVCALDGEPFINSVGLLASGLISNRAATLWRWLGGGRYVLASIGVLLGYRGQLVTWTSDAPEFGELPLQRFLLAEICNGPSTGGGFRLAPAAEPGDGLMDACLVRPVGAVTGLKLLPAAARGESIEHEAITRFRCRRIEIQCAEPVSYHRDGEAGTLSAGRHTIEILDTNLRVCVPAPAGPSPDSGRPALQKD